MGRFYAKMGRRNDIILRCDPDYAWGRTMWDAVLSDLPKPRSGSDSFPSLFPMLLKRNKSHWSRGCAFGLNFYC